MYIVNSDDYGIKDGCDITEALYIMIADAAGAAGRKLIEIKKGTYHIDARKCREYRLVITNTAAEYEFSPEERPHINAVPFYIGGIKNLTLDAQGSIFIIDGRTTNISVEDCEDITIKNLEIRTVNPDMHELQVIKKDEKHVVFRADSESLIKDIDGIPYFYGKDYKRSFISGINDRHIGLIHKDTPGTAIRTLHPLNGYKKIETTDERTCRISYEDTSRFSIGDCFYIYDIRRQFAGVFINRSKNIRLENIRQTFNYSLALVGQDSENISLVNSRFAPHKDSRKKFASCADFIQFSMCRGLMKVENSYFEGAGDDCMNVHGVHFKIVLKERNKLTVRFMHPETYGFNPLRKGDIIAYINPSSLTERGRAEIISSKLVSDTDIELTVSCTENAETGLCIEDISACPDVEFINNTLTRIITRGILLTTRGKVCVRDNNFISCSMSGVLVSDDASSWYESGMCRDILIENNNFSYCGETPVLIKPENTVHEAAVHKNIRIISNRINFSGKSIYIKSSDGVIIQNNDFPDSDYLYTENCTNINAQ